MGFRIVRMKDNPLPQGEITAKESMKFFNNLLRNQQANFNQTYYKSSLGKGNFKWYKSRARSSSKGRYSQKCKNRVGSLGKSIFKCVFKCKIIK
jgi:hypothetical protein